MLIRLLAGVLALALTGLYAVRLDLAQPAEIRKAARLAGERWYELLMEGDHIGYVHTRSWRDARGDWRFETLTHFSLNREAPVSVSDALHFQAAPPYLMIAAEHWNRRGGSAPEGFVMQSDGDAMIATFVHGAEAQSRPADWNYRLRDYLGLEVWLAEQRPGQGGRFTARMPDFDRGKPVKRTFRVLEENVTGYLIETPAPLRATTIQLDREFAPVELAMAGVFTVTRATRGEALAARTPLHLTSYDIPLDQRLEEHANIERLRLSGGGLHDLSRVWPSARRSAGEWLLELSANTLSRPDNPATELAETLSYPIYHPQVERLTRQATGNSQDAGERLARLVQFVHEYIAYRPEEPQRTVLETIAERSGDCTEFANLLTALARSAGLPARTVMGLAYAESLKPSTSREYAYPGANLEPEIARQHVQDTSLRPRLAFHAWNEIAIDGVWRVVDPTWNQLRADATHIPMPDNQAALLQAMQGRDRLAFKVEDIYYGNGA